MNLLPFLAGIVSIGLLTGCATRKAYVPDPAHPIRKVAVNGGTEPETMFFSGFSEAMGAGVAIAVVPMGGAVAAEVTNQRPIPGVRISDIMRSEFEQELRRASLFQLAQYPNADATFHLEVSTYGFVQSAPLSRSVRPILRVKARLVRNDGAVLWQDSSYVTGKTPSNLAEKVKYTPGVAEDALRSAAQIVSRSLVTKMTKAR